MSHYPDNDEVGWVPFRICILADVEPSPDYALRVASPLTCRRIMPGNFERVIAAISPSFRLTTRDPLSRAELEVDIRFEDSKDFGFGAIVRSAPVRTFVDAIEACSRSTDELGDLLTRLFGERASRLLGLLPKRLHPQPRTNHPVLAGGATLPHHEILDGLLGLVDLPGNAPTTEDVRRCNTERAAIEVEHELRQALEFILNALQGDSEYRRLTRTWRSIRTLCEAIKDSAWIELYVLYGSGTIDDCRTNLERLEPDLVVLESPISACARDSERISALADWASDSSIPILATLADDWVIGTPLTGRAEEPTRAKLSAPAMRLLSSISSRESSRWLTLGLNDVCIAGPNTERLGCLRGTGYGLGHDRLTNFTFLPAGVAIATTVVGSLLENGHPYPQIESKETRIRSPEVRIVGEPISGVAIGTRYLASTDDAIDLERLGVCCVVPVPNRDVVCPRAFTTTYRPRTNSGDLGRPESTLGDQLFASRLTRVIRRVTSTNDSKFEPRLVETELERQVQALFPNAPPVGPEVRISCLNGRLDIQVTPHRFGSLQVETFQAACQLAE